MLVNWLNTEPKMTVNEGRYLMLIYRKEREELSHVRTMDLARSFGVQPATVTEMLQKLAERSLLKYTRYRGVKLTEKGVAIAQRLLRKHRLLEVLFVNTLNYNVQDACNEASKLDHHASENLVNNICRTYGHPEICPCNKTIFGDGECGRESH